MCGLNSCKCLSLPKPDTPEPAKLKSTQVILFQGTNQNNFQDFVGATGKASDVVSYTVANDGAAVAFAVAINGVGLLRSYTFYICVDVPVGTTGIPDVAYQLARVDFAMNQSVTGTLIFTSKQSDGGAPHQARASFKGVVGMPYQLIDAWAMWTDIKPGAAVTRDQIVSLYLVDKIGNEEAAFQVFLLASNG